MKLGDLRSDAVKQLTFLRRLDTSRRQATLTRERPAGARGNPTYPTAHARDIRTIHTRCRLPLARDQPGITPCELVCPGGTHDRSVLEVNRSRSDEIHYRSRRFSGRVFGASTREMRRSTRLRRRCLSRVSRAAAGRGGRRLWVHSNLGGRPSHLRRAQRRHGGVLGGQPRGRIDAACGRVHAGLGGELPPHVRCA
jgi:hypothetical protein